MISKLCSIRGFRAIVTVMVLGSFLPATFGRIPLQAISRFKITKPVLFGTADSLSEARPLGLGRPDKPYGIGLQDKPLAVGQTNIPAKHLLAIKELDREYGLRTIGSSAPPSFELGSGAKSKPIRIKFEDEQRFVSFEPAPAPHRTAEQLKADSWSKPASVLADLHPDVAAVATRLSEDGQRKVLVALAQGLKAGVHDDGAPAFSLESIQRRIRAADAVRELTALAVEAEVNSPEHVSQWMTLIYPHTALARFRSSNSSTKSFTYVPENLLEKQNAEQQFGEAIEARLMKTLQGLRNRNAIKAGGGAWAQYVSESQPGLAIRTLSQGADGSASVKLNTSDFDSMTGSIPVRPIARALARDSGSPEVAMLMPRQ